MTQEYEEIDMEIIWITDEALLLSDGDKEGWIPVSQIKDYEHNRRNYEKNGTYTFEIAVWQLEDKGFI
jgi:hypothetical protein